jgi:hypothetical protein
MISIADMTLSSTLKGTLRSQGSGHESAFYVR